MQAVGGALSWILLFVLSAIASGFVLVLVAFATKDPFLVDGIVSYYSLVNEFYAGDISALSDPSRIVPAANFALVGCAVGYFPVIAVAAVNRRRSRIPLRKPSVRTVLFCMALAAIVNLVLEALMGVVLPFVPDAAQDSLDLVNLLATRGSPLVVVLVAGIAGPVAEEIVLRRGVQRSLQSINPTMAILVTSAVFGLLHGNPLQGVFAFCMGLVFGYVYYKTDNIFYSVAMHVTVNMSACAIMLSGLPEAAVYTVLAGVLLMAVAIWPEPESPLYPGTPSEYDRMRALGDGGNATRAAAGQGLPAPQQPVSQPFREASRTSGPTIISTGTPEK